MSKCSTSTVSRKFFSNVRQNLSRLEVDEMLDVEVNGMIWRIFTSATMKAAVHFGQNYEEPLFDISQSLILNHKSEIYGISTIEWNTTPWMRSTVLHDRAINLSLIPCFVLERFMNIVLLHRSGTNKKDGSWIPRTTKN